jgi:hypothetical protein
MGMQRVNGNGSNPKPTKRPTRQSKDFVDQMAMPGVKPTAAHAVVNIKNNNSGEPRLGFANNHDHVIAYKKSKVMRDHIAERKRIAALFCDVTPEQVLGATAMRAFATIDDAFDKNGNFDIKLARKTGAIHLVKKLKNTQWGLEAEFYSNESAQQQLANYLGMEFAPKDQSDDEASLKAGVEAVARAIAKDRDVEVDHHIRVEAWERVAHWVQDSKARYSPKALEELNKQYGDTVEGDNEHTGNAQT